MNRFLGHPPASTSKIVKLKKHYLNRFLGQSLEDRRPHQKYFYIINHTTLPYVHLKNLNIKKSHYLNRFNSNIEKSHYLNLFIGHLNICNLEESHYLNRFLGQSLKGEIKLNLFFGKDYNPHLRSHSHRIRTLRRCLPSTRPSCFVSERAFPRACPREVL